MINRKLNGCCDQMERSQGEHRPSKRAKYSNYDNEEPSKGFIVTEYSTEDLFNSDGSFKEWSSDAFMDSIANEEEIATPLADLPPVQFGVFSSSIMASSQDQPLYATKTLTENESVLTKSQSVVQEPVSEAVSSCHYFSGPAFSRSFFFCREKKRLSKACLYWQTTIRTAKRTSKICFTFSWDLVLARRGRMCISTFMSLTP